MPNVRTLTIGGVTYDLQDNISGYITGITSSDITTALGFTPYNATNPNGYTTNTGTITSVKTTAGTHTTIDVNSGAAAFNVPTKTSHLTNDSGFLTSYTETDPTVPSWAKASSKPSYNFSEIGNTPTTLSGYGITNAYTKTEVDGLVSGVLHYKGTKTTTSALPSSGNTTGDVWHVTADGSEWAWDGSAWQELGTAIDLSEYVVNIRDDYIESYITTETGDDCAQLHYLKKSTNISSDIRYGAGWISLSTNSNGTGYISFDSEHIGPTVASNWVPTADTDFTTKAYVDNAIPNVPSWALQSTKPSYTATEVGALPSTTAIPSKTSDLTNDSGFITGYTETDPVFSASAAAEITSSDISNWNGKSNTDTKNTAGSTNSTSKLYLIGATSQVTNSQTYSNEGLYVDENGVLNAPDIYSENSLCTYPGFSEFEFNSSYFTISTKIYTQEGVSNSARGVTISGDYTGLRLSSRKGDAYDDVTNYLQISSEDQSMVLTNLVTPTNNLDAANKLYVDSKHDTKTATLTTTWTSNQQTVTVSGVTSSNYIIVSPAPVSYDAYCEAGVYCSAQGTNSLTFKCDTVPESSLTVNVMIVN